MQFSVTGSIKIERTQGKYKSFLGDCFVRNKNDLFKTYLLQKVTKYFSSEKNHLMLQKYNRNA